MIKNAITYKAELPARLPMEDHLSLNSFKELGKETFSSSGFEPMFSGAFVKKFEGGYAFNLRYDEKILPASVLNDELKKRVKTIETEELRDVDKKERKVIAEEIYTEFIHAALIKSKNITCFYLTGESLLIIPTVSKKLADIVTSRLIKAVVSIKASTIYVSSMSHGLTSKVQAYLHGDESIFKDFEVTGVCKLKGDEGLSRSFVPDDITDAKDGIIEAINQGLRVTEIGLKNDSMSFKLNADFQIKGIRFLAENEEEYENPEEEFEQESAIQTFLFSNANNALMEMFEYKEPSTEAI